MESWSLYDQAGHRKYLTGDERRAFLRSLRDQPAEVRTFCRVLCETGCRVSEALSLTVEQIDAQAGMIIIESLKKRRHGVHRAVPVSEDLLGELDDVHAIAAVQAAGGANAALWPWCRMTGYRRVKEVMASAKVVGPHATPKGLRHGFAIAALEKGVPLHLVQKWLGHASLATTAIYGDAVGAEERKIASRLWT